MPKLRVIIKPPPEPQGEPEQQVEALRDYLLQMSEELAYVLTHLEADNINDSTFERIQSMIPRPYTGLPVMDGEASSGQSEQWARGDHRHGHDSSKADVTALDAEAAAREAHEADTDNPHEVTKAQVGLGNVANERQYSAQNPPPIPTPGEVGAIPATEKGSAGGVAELDSGGHVPSSQLPSYVDDVKEYPSVTDFPIPGESDKIYIALDTDLFYRWGGTVYAPTNPSLALGETSSTAYRGDRGKIAYDHSQTTGNPHGTTAAEVGARPDNWTPTAADVGARPDDWMPSKADVGLGNVEDERQYSAQNPPPYPVTSVNGSTGAVSLGAADVGARPDNWVPDAEDIPYDNTQSGLMATDVQAAIDELAQGGGGGGTAASAVSYDNTGSGLLATNVQDAIDEVVDDLDGKQDTITASGILKGDGQGGMSAATAGTDYQAPLIIDATPTANSTNPVQSGGVYTDVRTRVPNYGKGQNLLRNWYFVGVGTGRGVFPVNQRGANSYSGQNYSIDGWKIIKNTSTTPVLNVTAAGLVCTNDSTYIQCALDGAVSAALSEKTVTISLLSSDGTLYKVSGTVHVYPNASNFGLNNSSIYLYVVSNTTAVQIIFRCRLVDSTKAIVAVKLELGEEQTLCHNEGTDANPVWVLNEIPDYEEELIKCQTSTADPSDTYANKSLATEQQLAPVEWGTTASRTYAVGEYFCWNGLLYRAKTAISSGGTFTPGTNCEQVTVGDSIRVRPRYYQYYGAAAATYTHNFEQDTQFLIVTTGLDYSRERAFGIYYGFVSKADARYSKVITGLQSPTTQYPCSFDVSAAGVLVITSVANVKITVVEFPAV